MRITCAVLLVVAVTAISAENPEVSQKLPEVDEGDGSFLALGRCLLHARKLECAERRAEKALRKLREEENAVDEFRSATDMTDLEKQLSDAASSVFGLEGKNGNTEAEGRGKHKKKIHKIIALIKIVLLIVVIKLKLVFLMFVGQTLFQFKIMIFTFVIMAIKKYKLWQEYKHSKLEAHKPVVYYEHANHQHHYDESDHFHDGLGGLIGGAGHYGKEIEAAPSGPSAHGSGWGLWGKRSYTSPHDVAYGAYAPVHQSPPAAGAAGAAGEKSHFG